MQSHKILHSIFNWWWFNTDWMFLVRSKMFWMLYQSTILWFENQLSLLYSYNLYILCSHGMSWSKIRKNKSMTWMSVLIQTNKKKKIIQAMFYLAHFPLSGIVKKNPCFWYPWGDTNKIGISSSCFSPVWSHFTMYIMVSNFSTLIC